MAKDPPHYIVGHKNPDTDSVVSAHVLAWLHRQTDPESQATAIRLGEVNRQSAWLFEQAGCALPPLRKSCLYQAGEISRVLPFVQGDCPLREALETMQRAGTEFVAVVDAGQRPLGIISDRTQRTNYLLQCNVEDLMGTLLDFKHLVRGLPLQRLSHDNAENIQRLDVPLHKSTVSGDWDSETAIVIGDRELFLDLIRQNPPGAVIVTGVHLDRAQAIARKFDCPCYFYTGSVISMLTRLPGCFPASAAMIEDYNTVEEDADEESLVRQLHKAKWGLMVLDPNGYVIGAISARDLLNLPRPKVSLVDHSERGQSIGGLNEAEVVEIIDHHRLGDIETIQPLLIDVRPLGSTASILYDRILEAGLQPSIPIAALLLGALISDTLLLRSPTCTDSDRQRAAQLAAIAGVELEAFGIEVLRRNDELASASPEALVQRDCKHFSFESVSFLAAQIETVDLSVLSEERAVEIESAFASVLRKEAVAFGAIMVTDVLANRSRMMVVSDDEKWRRILLPEAVYQSCAPWIEHAFVSRKKQMIPLLLQKIKSAAQV